MLTDDMEILMGESGAAKKRIIEAEKKLQELLTAIEADELEGRAAKIRLDVLREIIRTNEKIMD